MNIIHKSAVFVFLMVSIYSCKQNADQKNTDNQTIEKESSEKDENDKPSQFSLTLRALIQKDDLFQLYYIQENAEGYSADQVLTKEVLGNDEFQNITFNMPAEFYPFNIRLDFGTNNSQTSIKIQNCTLKYGSSEFAIKSNEMKDYFIFNEGVEIQSDSTTFRLKSFKEGTIDKYDPFLMGNLKLNDVLLKKL